MLPTDSINTKKKKLTEGVNNGEIKFDSYARRI